MFAGASEAAGESGHFPAVFRNPSGGRQVLPGQPQRRPCPQRAAGLLPEGTRRTQYSPAPFTVHVHTFRSSAFLQPFLPCVLCPGAHACGLRQLAGHPAVRDGHPSGALRHRHHGEERRDAQSSPQRSVCTHNNTASCIL